MSASTAGPLPACLRHSPVEVLFGPGTVAQLTPQTARFGQRVLLVTDGGLVGCGHAERAVASLRAAKLDVAVFDGSDENPTTEHVDRGLKIARAHRPEVIIGFGGGSPMDCAKGINILLTHEGTIRDYWGVNKTSHPLLPMIAVPTTSGTGSEAQSFALISDSETHAKMACGDRRLPAEGGLRPHVAILDPDLTATVPAGVRAATAVDALTHAIETAGTRVRNEISAALSREAWDLLSQLLPASLEGDAEARAGMQLGAHLAGAAIEQSMLGAAHAMANPLTARYGMTHGHAVGLMLPPVMQFNTEGGKHPYEALGLTADELIERFIELRALAGLPEILRDTDIPEADLPELAELASQQWTAQFNPRPVQAADLLRLYRAVW